jgi:hypothetical protein
MRDTGVEIVEAGLARMAAGVSRERLLDSLLQAVFRIFIQTAPGAAARERIPAPPTQSGLLTTLPGVLMMLQDPAEELP